MQYAHDKILDAYLGKFGKRFMRDSHMRIHWVCSQVCGNDVLDVGCGQGVASVLLAREGFRVTGIDLDPEAIRDANSYLKEQGDSVRPNVQFLRDDFMSHDFGEKKFDTIIMSELVEHLVQPERFIERATRLLNPSGSLVVTVPFGINEFIDHKRTYYALDPLKLVWKEFVVNQADVLGRWIGFSCVRREKPAEDVFTEWPWPLMEKAETEFLSIERALTDKTQKGLRQLRETQDRLDAATENSLILETKLATKDSELERLRENFSASSKEVSGLRAALAKNEAKAERLSADLAVTKRELTESVHNQASAKERMSATTKRLVTTNQKLLESNQQTKRANQKLSEVYSSPTVQLVRHLYNALTSFSGFMHLPAGLWLVSREWRTRRRRRREEGYQGTLPETGDSEINHVSKTELEFPEFRPFCDYADSKLTIATILDKFSESCFRYEANLMPLSLANWKQELQDNRPAFLLVESAWRGNDGQWRYSMTQYGSRPQNALRDLLRYCKEQGIKRVFWNKEDPPNFDIFKYVAADFDVVFTTDSACVPRYKKFLHHDFVYALPFAAQPAIHNPIQNGVTRNRDVCFAGSWRADKYPERAVATEALLTPALQYELDIFDRNAGSKDAEKFAFPPTLKEAVRGSLAYERMLSAYRSYRVFLSVNSVTDSRTMFARRVFELMACGTPVISSESTGIREMFGSLVKIASTSAETRSHLESLLADDSYRARYAHVGYREVLGKHTYSHRLQTILKAVGRDGSAPEEPLVTILAATNRPTSLDNLLNNVRRQIYPNVELILLLNSDSYDRSVVEKATADLSSVKIFGLPEDYTLAECLNYGFGQSNGRWIAKFDDDDYYGSNYLSDLVLTTSYTDAKIIGKRSYYVFLEGAEKLALRFPGHEHRHTPFVHGGTLLVKRDVLDEVGFSPVKQGTDTAFQRECMERGIRIYSADPYNFIHVRRADVTTHTWQVSEQDILDKGRVVANRLDMGQVMI